MTPEPTATPTPQSTATLTPTPTPVPFSVRITDSNGQEITFNKPPERIVAYDSAPVEILFAMGEGDRIVGTHDFFTFPPEASQIPKVGGAFNVNSERIVELEPDLIYTFYSGSLTDLEGLGTKVLYLEAPNDLAGIEEQIHMWGAITDNAAGAEEVAQEFKTRVEALEERLASVEEGPRLFQDNSSFWSPGPDTLVGGLYTLLKAQNIAHDTSGYTQFSPEVIVDRDPQVIIVTFPDTLQVYQDNPAFQDISAVKQGRVHAIDTDILSIAGPRIIEGIEELAKLIHPELFE